MNGYFPAIQQAFRSSFGLTGARVMPWCRTLIISGAVSVTACSGSPTTPTPTTVVAVAPPVVAPPVVAPPVVTPPAPNPLLSDPRFNAAFFKQFAHGTLDEGFRPLNRQTEAPRIYLRTVDDAGRAMDALTINQTAAALINTTGALTGVFGLAGLEQGTGSKFGERGWITVHWAAEASPERFCGYALYAGDRITLYPRSPGCRCSGGPAVALATVKHELGHALGFYHTDARTDLMYPKLQSCDMQPSEREIFHARVAYSLAIGSLDP